MEKFNLELQDKGQFVFTDEAGQHYKGRFSIHALNRFCKAKNIDGYFSILEKITIGMSLEDYAELILFAFQDYYREDYTQCKWTTEKVMDEMIDVMGGITEKFMDLVKHGVNRIAPVKEMPGAADAPDSPEKKST